MSGELSRLLEPIRNRVRLMIARALVSAAFDEDAGGIKLTLDLGFGEIRDDLELVQQYGMTSRPKKGSQVVTLFLSGSRDAGVVIATKGMGADMSFRLAPGEVALHTDEGDSVHLKNGRVVKVTTGTLEVEATTAVNITAPVVSIEATGSMVLKAPALTLDSPAVSATGTVSALGALSAPSAAIAGAATMAGATVSGPITADEIGDSVGTLADMRTTYNSHTHASSAPTTPTSPPTPLAS